MLKLRQLFLKVYRIAAKSRKMILFAIECISQYEVYISNEKVWQSDRKCWTAVEKISSIFVKGLHITNTCSICFPLISVEYTHYHIHLPCSRLGWCCLLLVDAFPYQQKWLRAGEYLLIRVRPVSAPLNH